MSIRHQTRMRSKPDLGGARLALLVGLALLFAGLAWQPARSSEATPPAIAFAARVVGDAGRARLIVDFDRAIEHEIALAENPQRVVIELPATIFKLPDAIVRPSASLVKNVRYGVAVPSAPASHLNFPAVPRSPSIRSTVSRGHSVTV